MSEKGIKTKTLIRKKAYSLFAEHGFRAVTMKEICEECGLSRGGLYRHYGSTQQIFEEILKELSERSMGDVCERIKKGMSAREILDAVLNRMYIEMTEKETTLSYAVYEYSILCDNRFMTQLNRKARETWNILLRHGMERGEFLPVPIEPMVDVILYSYQGVRMWERVAELGEETARNIVEMIRYNLIREEGQHGNWTEKVETGG